MKYLLIFIFYIYAIIEALFRFIFDPSTRKKNNRRHPISDREKLKTFTGSEVRTLFRHIKQKYDSLSRKYVAACLKRYPRPILLTDQCECGCNVIAIHFCSPSWTWEKMCGRKGVIIICPKCLSVIDYRITEMN